LTNCDYYETIAIRVILSRIALVFEPDNWMSYPISLFFCSRHRRNLGFRRRNNAPRCKFPAKTAKTAKQTSHGAIWS
jgi:hypothetical protein